MVLVARAGDRCRLQSLAAALLRSLTAWPRPLLCVLQGGKVFRGQKYVNCVFSLQTLTTSVPEGTGMCVVLIRGVSEGMALQRCPFPPGWMLCSAKQGAERLEFKGCCRSRLERRGCPGPGLSPLELGPVPGGRRL